MGSLGAGRGGGVCGVGRVRVRVSGGPLVVDMGGLCVGGRRRRGRGSVWGGWGGVGGLDGVGAGPEDAGRQACCSLDSELKNPTNKQSPPQ